jgi:myo-inositol-1(or 4)-monophosphatase
VSWSAERAVARRAALAGASVVAAAMRDGPRSVRHKGAVDLVTEVDLAAERAVRAVLEAETPYPVMGEEGGGAAGAAARWVVDPLDGTTNFVHGFPVFAVSVGLEVDDVSVAGAIADPIRGRVYEAARGEGAWVGDARLAVSQTASLAQALVATGFPYDRRENAALYLEQLRRVLVRAQCVRRAGAATMDLVWTASGQLDAFFENHLHRWDVCAGVLLVEEAGGRVTGIYGGALDRDDVCFVVSNGRIHDALVRAIQEDRDGPSTEP